MIRYKIPLFVWRTLGFFYETGERTMKKLSWDANLRAYLQNKNIILYYKLKHLVGKKLAIKIALAICLLVNERG